jgi:hypothetical protein
MGVSSHKYPAIGQCCIHIINHKHLLCGASNPKTNNIIQEVLHMHYKTGIQLKFNMALLEIYRPWIIYESWYCVRRSISLCCIVLFDVDFQSCSIQALLSAFAYLTRVVWITSARSALCFNLTYTLKGMAPTPHVVMARSWKMWLEASLTSADLGTASVYCKST